MAKGVVRTLLQGLLVAAAVYVLAAGYFAWNLRVRSDLDSYDEYLAAWSSHLVNHFPARIKAMSNTAAISYFPGFLQGGAHLQLRIRVPLERARAEMSVYSKQAMHVAGSASPGAEGAEPETEHAIPLPPDYLAPQGVQETFSDNYTVYYIFAQPGTTKGFPWNHGQMAGVAISEVPPEIVYWAERW